VPSLPEESGGVRVKIILPLEVMIPRKTCEDKRVILNLNIYRNAHHMTLNQAKMEMAKHVSIAAAENEEEMPSPPFVFTYTVFPSTGRKFDLGNVCSIIQKFTDDALIEIGAIKDDNYKVVQEIVYKFGAVDKENPRAELEIKSIES
jgi:Holliday junction resolvase RusA-like endonuclease